MTGWINGCTYMYYEETLQTEIIQNYLSFLFGYRDSIRDFPESQLEVRDGNS